MKTKFWTKVNEFTGMPSLKDFEIVEEDVDENIATGGKKL